MAAGRRAFTGETAALVHNAILNLKPAAVHDVSSTVSPGLNAVIDKALEKDRSRRYQSASEMREDIEQGRREAQPDRRSRRWFGAIALLVVLMPGVTVVTSMGVRHLETSHVAHLHVIFVRLQVTFPT